MQKIIPQPPASLIKVRRIFGVFTLLVAAFVVPHLFGFSILFWASLLPDQLLLEIQSNPTSDRAAQIAKTAAIYEVTLLVMLLAGLSLVFSAIALMRTALIRLRGIEVSKGYGLVYQLALVAFPALILSSMISFVSSPSTFGTVHKVGLWGTALLPLAIILPNLLVTAIGAFSPTSAEYIELKSSESRGIRQL